MGRKKRTKSQSSPNSVREQPDKRMASSSPQISMQSPSGSFLSQMPPYPVNYYTTTPIQQQYLQQTQSPAACSTPLQNPLSMQNPNQAILDKLEMIDKRLYKLDSIDSQLKEMSKKISHIDTRVISLETSSVGWNKSISEIEASRAFDSSTCEDLKHKQSKIDESIKAEKSRGEHLSKHVESLKHENRRLSEEMIDLQSRSMRDNLLFYNFKEATLPEARKDENCMKTIFEFCQNTLEMTNVQSTIKIDRAHRVGIYSNGKTRPIVVKFNYFQDKVNIKRLVHERSDSTDVKVSDQYPRAIQERRKTLIPELIKAKNEGKVAVLNYDKLLINGRRFVPVKPTP